MINFSIKNLTNTLINIITESPTSILFIILGTIFTVAMIINIKRNKTIGKTLYIIGWIFIIMFIIIKYNNFISKIMDNLINNIFMQIFFPNIATYTIIIIITNILFLYTIFKKNSKTIDKLINSPFFIIIMVLMTFTMEQVSTKKINIYSKEEVYTNDKVLTLIESTTLIFIIWIVIIISKIIISKLIKKSNEKVIKEFEEKNETKTTLNETNNQVTTPVETPTINNINQNNAIPNINQVTTPIETPTVNNINQNNAIPNINQVTTPVETPTINNINQNNAVPNTPNIEIFEIKPETNVNEKIEPIVSFPKQEDEKIEPIISFPKQKDEKIEPIISFPKQKDEKIEPIISFPKQEDDIEILNI